MIYGSDGAFSARLAFACLAFVLVALVGPGLAIQRLLRLRPDRALVLPIGLAFCAGSHWLSLWSGVSWLFPVLGLGLGLSLVLPIGAWSWADGPSLRRAAPPFLGLLLLLAVSEYPLNRFGAQGNFLVDAATIEDSTFHAGLAWELSYGYPPQVPGLSGFTLGYHLGLPLIRAAAVRWADVHPYDSLNRIDPTVMGLALILVLRGAARAVGGGGFAAALAGWAPLATNLSWLFLGTASHRGLDIGDIGLSNSAAPALALSLAAVIALARHAAGEGRAWLALATALCFAVPFFKVFVGAHLLLAIVLAAVVTGRWRVLALPVVLLALATSSLVLGPGAARWSIGIEPLLPVRAFIGHLGRTAPSVPLIALWTVLWIVAIASVRLLAVPAALRALRSRNLSAAILAALALSGWAIGLIFKVTLIEGARGRTLVNNADYFIDQSGFVLWVFVASALTASSLPTRATVVMWASCGALALSGNMVRIASGPVGPGLPLMPTGIAEAMGALARESQPGDVVLQKPQPKRYPPPPVVLIGRRVPLSRSISYLTQFATQEAIDRRQEMVQRFFLTSDAEEALTVARSLGARYLCLYGSDVVRFPEAQALEPVFGRPNVRVYRILVRPARTSGPG